LKKFTKSTGKEKNGGTTSESEVDKSSYTLNFSFWQYPIWERAFTRKVVFKEDYSKIVAKMKSAYVGWKIEKMAFSRSFREL